MLTYLIACESRDRTMQSTMAQTTEKYQYTDLPHEGSFRILELLPGKEDDAVSISLHVSNLSNPREYEAVSYTWGNAISKATFLCGGKIIDATTNLHAGLSHLRHKHKSRFLWVDALW